jgi:PPOX class probable FMN-dependent enzyme
MRAADIITSEAQLRAIIGAAFPRALRKEITSLDVHCRAIIAQSPFVLISSSDAAGRQDVSPKGDPPGFVQVLDDRTLAIPDRPGNRRTDTFRNVLQNPRVGLLFLVPGRNETLRVNGTATIVRDAGLRERMAVNGKLPELALVVSAEEVFVHCGKCMLRARLWEPDAWTDVTALPSHARCLVDHARMTEPLAEVEETVRENYVRELY